MIIRFPIFDFLRGVVLRKVAKNFTLSQLEGHFWHRFYSRVLSKFLDAAFLEPPQTINF
jgi:hypothetical protein